MFATSFACQEGIWSKHNNPTCEDIESRSDMACVPAGSFVRGSERESRQEDTGAIIKDESPVQTIEVSAFLMDVNEVTYAEYQACAQAGGCPTAGPNYRVGYSGPDQPMLGANWFAARTYCNWKGKRLPTEAEWEKAARGPEGELYPWGNQTATCELAIIKEDGRRGCGTGYTWDVSSRPIARYGLHDMAGNSWEWVNDWYSESYGDCGEGCSGTDPQGPCNGADDCPRHRYKIVRGGSWWWDAEHALASNRRPHFPANEPFHHYGFRCAADLSFALPQ